MWLPTLGHVRCCNNCCDQDWLWIQAGSEEAQQAEKAAMQTEGVAVILNLDHDAPIEGSVFGGATWTHTWFSSSMWLVANPGEIALARAAPGAEGHIVFFASTDSQKEPQQLDVGGFYRWEPQAAQMVAAEQPRVARGAFLHFEKIQATASERKWGEMEKARRSHEESGLTLVKWQQADNMLAMCCQYLQLIGNKLRDELPKQVFMYLVQAPTKNLERTIIEMLHTSKKYEYMVDLFQDGAAQRALQRAHLEDQLAKLEQIQSQVAKLRSHQHGF